jgi:hypothetical protein
MTVEKRSTVVGVFHERTAAQQALAELRRVGFREDQIGVVSREEGTSPAATSAKTAEKESHIGKGAATGAAAGAGVGALWALGIVTLGLPAIGPVIAGGIFASILASAAGTAVAGGLVGALVGLGIPEEDAKYYEGEFKAGRSIVTVQSAGKSGEAEEIMRRFGAYDIHSRQATPAGR